MVYCAYVKKNVFYKSKVIRKVIRSGKGGQVNDKKIAIVPYVIVDVNHGDLQSLKREGVNLFLIPEDIARYIDYSSVSKDECFKLTHDEYESGNIDRVVKYIEEN